MLRRIRPQIRPLAAASALGLVLLGLVGPGCATVKPWERGRLSHPCMTLGERMGDRYLSHVASIREGATGGESAAGGGCGCN